MKIPYFRQPHVCDCGDHAFIGLTRAGVALADASAVDHINALWSCRRGYARRTVYDAGAKTHVSMHRLVSKANDGVLVDHRNHDRSDNRGSNLRLCDAAGNAQNARLRQGRKFKGVDYVKRDKLWRARISFQCKTIMLGYFATAEAAAAAYDIVAARLHGDFAFTNAEMAVAYAIETIPTAAAYLRAA